MFIDTHLHLVARDRITYPWLKDVAALDRDWTFQDYETTARRIGIEGVLHMEVDCAPTDIAAENTFVGELMAQPGSLMRGAISSARPNPGIVKHSSIRLILISSRAFAGCCMSCPTTCHKDPCSARMSDGSAKGASF